MFMGSESEMVGLQGHTQRGGQLPPGNLSNYYCEGAWAATGYSSPFVTRGTHGRSFGLLVCCL